MTKTELLNPLTGEPISDDDLKSLSAMVTRLKNIEKSIKDQEADIEKLKKVQKMLSMEMIPAAMESLGLSALSLDDGTALEVKPFYSAKIPDEKIVEAYNWLRKENLDSLIKVTANFGTLTNEQKVRVLKALDKIKVTCAMTEGIHHATLKALVRERTESGKPMPHDLFGVFVGKSTKLT